MRAAQITLDRVEKVLAQNQNDGAAIGHGSNALAVLGNSERAKEWMNRALLLDPDNLTMRYNFACALATYLKEPDAAVSMLEPFFANVSISLLAHGKIDPDLDPVRDDPRFESMLAAAEARLAAAGESGSSP